jgi:hypothetical protein
MAIPEGHKQNFQTILDATHHNDLTLMECTDKATGQTVYTVCAVYIEDNQYVFVPLAKMFDGDPYEELNPPE